MYVDLSKKVLPISHRMFNDQRVRSVDDDPFFCSPRTNFVRYYLESSTKKCRVPPR